MANDDLGWLDGSYVFWQHCNREKLLYWVRFDDVVVFLLKIKA